MRLESNKYNDSDDGDINDDSVNDGDGSNDGGDFTDT